MNPLLFPTDLPADAGNRLLAYDTELENRRIGNRLLDYGETSIDQLSRMGRAIDPMRFISERDVAAFLPGAGMVEGYEQMGSAARRFREGDYLGAAGDYALGAFNSVSDVIPAMAALPALRRADDLPMDEASRMARAERLGYTTDAYHGTRSDFDEFSRIEGGNAYGPGYYFTRDPAEASRYAEGVDVNRGASPDGDAGPNVMPVRLNMQRPFRMNAQLTRAELNAIEKAVNEVLPGYYKRGELARFFDRGYPPIGHNVWQNIPFASHVVRSAGYDSLDTPMGLVAFKPSQIRSRFAAFDPARRDSGNILAGVAPVAIVGGAALMREDEQQ